MRSSADVAAEASRQSERQALDLAARREKHVSEKPAAAVVVVRRPLADGETMKFVSVCRVKGHGSLYCEVLLRRPDWKLLGCQKWFEDDEHNQYHCPLGNRLVDFCDEMHFSRLAMYLKGRQCLENKMQLAMLVPELVPETFHIRDKQWVDGISPVDKDGDTLPWFVKEAEGNEGCFVECCQKACQCMDLAQPGLNYVVQQHVRDQLLYEGRKFHLRVHGLIICMEDGKTWSAYTYKDGYLNISPNRWTDDDITRDTQVVIYRSQRTGDWEPWVDLYPKFKASFTTAIESAVAQGKLEGRPGKKQFELTSCDYMVDTHGEVWLIEMNMGPVLRDWHLDPDCNDDDMITSAFEIVVPWQDPPNVGQWDFAGELIGAEPPPAAPPIVTPIVSPEVAEEIVDDEVVDDLMAYLSSIS